LFSSNLLGEIIFFSFPGENEIIHFALELQHNIRQIIVELKPKN